MEKLLNIPDMAVLAVALLLGIRGIMRGLSGELAHLVSSTLMVTLFIFIFNPATDYLVNDYGLALWLARTALVLAIMFITLGGFFLSSFIFKGLLTKGLSSTGDKFAGLLCGMFHGVLVMIVVLVLAYTLPHEGFFQRVYVRSCIGRFVHQRVMPVANRYLSKHIAIPAGVPAQLPLHLND